MQTTAQELIISAMRTVGYIGGKELPTPEDMQLGLDELQQIMDSWKLESLLSVYDGTASFTTQPNQNIITIGPTVTNDIVMDERPTEILGAWVTNSSNQQIPISEVRDVEYWRSFRDMNSSTTYPKYFCLFPSYPDATIELYQKSSQAFTFNMAYRVMPVIPTLISDVLNYSQGWIYALRYNLASNLSLPLGVPLGAATEMIDARALESRARIKRARLHPTPRAIIDAALGMGRYSSGGRRNGYNVNGDSYNGVI